MCNGSLELVVRRPVVAHSFKKLDKPVYPLPSVWYCMFFRSPVMLAHLLSRFLVKSPLQFWGVEF